MELPIDYDKSHWKVRKEAREEYVKRQEGLCQHCNEPLSGPPSKGVQGMRVDSNLFPDNFFKWPIHLHHYHKTGVTIGAVHAKCNAVLWQYHGE